MNKKNQSNVIPCEEYSGCLVKRSTSRDKRCISYSLLTDIKHDRFDTVYDIISVLSFRDEQWIREVFFRKDVISFCRVI